MLFIDKNLSTKACLSYQFACNNGLCIPQEWACDGTKDCPDGEDETESLFCKWILKYYFGRYFNGEIVCYVKGSCSQMEFKCLKYRQCIIKAKVCDGVKHCNDSSDENHCCNSLQFICRRLVFIVIDYWYWF